MNKKSTLGISAICIALTAIFVLLSGFVPVLNIMFMIAASVMTAYCFIRCGYVAGVINILVSASVTLILGGFNPYILLIPAMGIIPGIVSGIMTKSKSEYYTHLFGIAISAFLVMFASLYISGVMSGEGINGIFNNLGEALKKEFDEFGLYINETLNEAMRENNEIIQFNLTTENISEFIDAIIVFMKMVFPSMMIVFALIMGFIHLILLKVLSDKTGCRKMDYVHIDAHCAPRSMAYVYFISSIIIMFSGDGGAFSVVLNNVTVVLDVILALCGFSFLESKFKKVLRFKGLRWLIYISGLLISSNLAIQVLSFIGMFDSFMDFRGIRRMGE